MSKEEAAYRLSVATEFLQNAMQSLNLQQWSIAVSQSQLAVENAAKAPLAYHGPVPQTHEPEYELSQIVTGSHDVPEDVRAHVFRLIVCVKHLGTKEHILATYGDERVRLKPSEIWFEPEARLAVSYADRAVESARAIMEFYESQ